MDNDLRNSSDKSIPAYYIEDLEINDEYDEELRKLKSWIGPIEDNLVQPDDKCANSRRALVHLFYSKPFNLAVIVLAMIDATILIAVLLLEIEALKLSHGPTHIRIHNARFGLECISLTIVSLFTIEITFKLFAVGLKHFFRSWIEVLDAIVTLVSVCIDALVIADHVEKYVKYSGSIPDNHSTGVVDSLGPAAGLLVLFRVWRIIRIVNATLMSIGNAVEKKMSKMKRFQALYVQRIILLERILKQNHVAIPEDAACLINPDKLISSNTYLATSRSMRSLFDLPQPQQPLTSLRV